MPDRLRADVPVQITWSIPHPEMAGRMLDDIARGWGCDAARGRRTAAAGRRDLLPDGRAGRAAASWRIRWR